MLASLLALLPVQQAIVCPLLYPRRIIVIGFCAISPYCSCCYFVGGLTLSSPMPSVFYAMAPSKR